MIIFWYSALLDINIYSFKNWDRKHRLAETPLLGQVKMSSKVIMFVTTMDTFCLFWNKYINTVGTFCPVKCFVWCAMKLVLRLVLFLDTAFLFTLTQDGWVIPIFRMFSTFLLIIRFTNSTINQLLSGNQHSQPTKLCKKERQRSSVCEIALLQGFMSCLSGKFAACCTHLVRMSPTKYKCYFSYCALDVPFRWLHMIGSYC